MKRASVGHAREVALVGSRVPELTSISGARDTSGKARLPAALPDIRIVKLVAKGDFAAPQTLLVVGTAVARGDVWVCFDNIPPDDPLPNSPSSWSIRAVPVDLDAVPTTQAKPNGPRQRDAPFDFDPAPGEWMWVARFDLPDRANLAAQWQWFAQQPQPDPALRILVRAWHARPDPPWEADLGANATRTHVPVDPHPVDRPFTSLEVETIPLFELGVLLVHGIGKHKVRETLIRFGEPFVLFWERWLRAMSGVLAAGASTSQRALLRNRMLGGVWLGMQDNEREIRALRASNETSSAAGIATGAAPIDPPGLACGVAHVEDTIFKTPSSEMPSSTLTRLSVIGADGELRQAHVLLSEAWWTGETFYPSFAELFVWITQALPIALRMYAAGVLRSSRDDLKESRGLLKGNFLGTARVLLDWLAFILKGGLLLPLLVLAFALAQVGLLALLLLSLVPFDAVRGRIRGAVDLLLGTVGQSYALKTSSVRRNAMVRAVIRDLEFVAGKCQRVAVVSHSQGAEVARMVFQSRRWPKVRRWVTFGAGIVPLAMLDEGREADRLGRWAAALLQLCSVVVAAVAVLALADAYFATRLPWLGQAAAWSRSYGLALGAVAGAILVAILMDSTPAWRSDFSRTMFAKWHNYYASHDPVPGGPIQDNETLDKDQRIYNTRFGLRDHTTYFDNTEQFVAPVALDFFELAGLGRCVAAAAPALANAASRRDIHTWQRMKLRGVALLTFVGIVGWTLLHDSAANAKAWGGAVSAAWTSADGWAAWMALWNSGTLGNVVIELWAAWALVLAYFILRPAWSGWWTRRSRDQLFRELAGILNGGGGLASARHATTTTASTRT